MHRRHFAPNCFYKTTKATNIKWHKHLSETSVYYYAGPSHRWRPWARRFCFFQAYCNWQWI